VKRFSGRRPRCCHTARLFVGRAAWRPGAVLAGSGQKGHSAPDSKAGVLTPAHGDQPIVTASTLFRRVVGVALCIAALTLPATVAAQKNPRTPQKHSPPPPANELARVSKSGNYLAARHANVQRDARAASAFYRAALRSDPRNSELLQRAFLAVLSEGDVDEAVRLAERVVHVDRNDRIARLVLGVRALRLKHYNSARQQLAQSVRGPITDLAGTLLIAWAQHGAGDTRAAVETIDKLQGNDAYTLFKDFHAGLMLDLAHHKRDAGRRFDRAHKLDSSALRLVEAYGSWLSRNGQKDEALKVFQGFNAQLPRHPLIVEAMNTLRAGKHLPPLIETTQTGAAEVLYGLAAALGRRGGEELGLIYFQLALYLAPHQPLALLSLADLYEQLKNPEVAIKTYERVPTSSPLRRNAEIQLAVNLDALDRTEEAKARLNKLIAGNPDDLEAIMALGNILRGRKSYAECAEVYGKGIATIAKPERPHWLIFYFRGICNERAKKWVAAEADLKAALKLYPDEPHVLNYLGYSWIDQGINLDEGMRMIKRAVEQRPDDGYIVDSLGWAYYRLGNYEEAMKHLDRAVELKPDDPTINDHLGDVYWKNGRFLEARFQWSHAKDLKPEAEELAKIEKKLKEGLVEETSSAADAGKKNSQKKPDDGG
jgi:tetratricopeptide (TPR) repeat protein